MATIHTEKDIKKNPIMKNMKEKKEQNMKSDSCGKPVRPGKN